MFEKLRQIEERSRELARLLADPAVASQPSEYTRLRKEHAEISTIVGRFEEYRTVLNRLAEARHILAEEGARELHEPSELEVDELNARQAALDAELPPLRLPKDPYDDKAVVIELRAAPGGDAAG